MSLVHLLFPRRTRSALDDAARDRALKLWMTTGAVPVAHMVADLGAMGDPTGEYERPVPLTLRAGTTYAPSSLARR